MSEKSKSQQFIDAYYALCEEHGYELCQLYPNELTAMPLDECGSMVIRTEEHQSWIGRRPKGYMSDHDKPSQGNLEWLNGFIAWLESCPDEDAGTSGVLAAAILAAAIEQRDEMQRILSDEQ
jgi:hypothetical protein